MKNLIKFLVVSIVLSLPVISLACDYPERPTLPNGGTAAKEDMIAAQSAVKGFLAAVDEYLTCIEQEEKAAIEAMDNPDEETIKRRDDLLAKRFDAANEEKFMFGEQWNQQVRAYNEAKSAAKSE
ncbi:MAG: hypothetical protein ACR2QX_15725 [Woeseiaceae bacterium]